MPIGLDPLSQFAGWVRLSQLGAVTVRRLGVNSRRAQELRKGIRCLDEIKVAVNSCGCQGPDRIAAVSGAIECRGIAGASQETEGFGYLQCECDSSDVFWVGGRAQLPATLRADELKLKVATDQLKNA